MAGTKKATQPKDQPAVEVLTDETKKTSDKPLVTVRTGQTNNQTFYFKINQPRGRAILIAVHL